MSREILVSEVGPRDGLQSIKSIMPLEAKKAWISALAHAGVREIEVGSFVPAQVLPQLADTAAVVEHARTISGLTVAVLVPKPAWCRSGGSQRCAQAHAALFRLGNAQPQERPSHACADAR